MSLNLSSIRTDTTIEIGLGIVVAGITLATSYLWRDLWVECVKQFTPKEEVTCETQKISTMFFSALLGTITATMVCVCLVIVMLWIDKHKFSGEPLPHLT